MRVTNIKECNKQESLKDGCKLCGRYLSIMCFKDKWPW